MHGFVSYIYIYKALGQVHSWQIQHKLANARANRARAVELDREVRHRAAVLVRDRRRVGPAARNVDARRGLGHGADGEPAFTVEYGDGEVEAELPPSHVDKVLSVRMNAAREWRKVAHVFNALNRMAGIGQLFTKMAEASSDSPPPAADAEAKS